MFNPQHIKMPQIEICLVTDVSTSPLSKNHSEIKLQLPQIMQKGRAVPFATAHLNPISCVLQVCTLSLEKEHPSEASRKNMAIFMKWVTAELESLYLLRTTNVEEIVLKWLHTDVLCKGTVKPWFSLKQLPVIKTHMRIIKRGQIRKHVRF